MTYSAMAVANALIKRAKEEKLDNLSPMKLQKLLFYIQSWYLARNGSPLMDDFFCRWQYGPVIPSLYHEFKEYGPRTISTYGGHLIEEDGRLVKKQPIIDPDDKETWRLIDEIINAYGKLNGSQLSYMTHQKGSAWEISGSVDGNPIQNSFLSDAIKNDAIYKQFYCGGNSGSPS